MSDSGKVIVELHPDMMDARIATGCDVKIVSRHPTVGSAFDNLSQKIIADMEKLVKRATKEEVEAVFGSMEADGLASLRRSGLVQIQDLRLVRPSFVRSVFRAIGRIIRERMTNAG